MSTWTLIGIIYGLCLIPAILLTKLLYQELKFLRPHLVFLTVWLVLPLFPFYLLYHKKKNNG